MKYALMIAIALTLPTWCRAGEGDYVEKIPGTLVTFTMIGLPAGKVTVHPLSGGAKEAEINKSLQSKVAGLKDWQILQKNFERMK